MKISREERNLLSDMSQIIWIFKVLVIEFMFKGCYLITTVNSNGAAEILWNLSGRALYGDTLGRQYGNRYQSPNTGFGFQPQYPPVNTYRPSVYPGNPYRPPVYYPNSQPPQNFMSVLDTIAKNDDLQCVPKLLCELTSGSRTVTGKQSSFLPFDLNMESLIGALSSFSSGQVSPLLLFGRAILLGYSTKGNSGSCSYSFPRCPNDPDKLVRYLNNYNGGFFRYFQGVPYQQPPHVHTRVDGKYRAEQRIQTKPTQLMSVTSDLAYNGGNRFRTDIKFPSDNYPPSNYLDDSFYGYPHKSQKTLRFPSEEYFRRPKLLSFPATNAINNVFHFEKILPNHVASPVIFPTRTGTGELIIDSDDFKFDSDFNQSNNVIFT